MLIRSSTLWLLPFTPLGFVTTHCGTYSQATLWLRTWTSGNSVHVSALPFAPRPCISCEHHRSHVIYCHALLPQHRKSCEFGIVARNRKGQSVINHHTSCICCMEKATRPGIIYDRVRSPQYCQERQNYGTTKTTNQTSHNPTANEQHYKPVPNSSDAPDTASRSRVFDGL